MKILVIGDSCIDIFRYGEVIRLAPEAPIPIIKPQKETKTSGMAGNVVENLKALGAEVDFLTNYTEIRKIRYVCSKYNHLLLRVDENDQCDRYTGEYETIGYDALIISDYNKGFLTKEDIEAFAERSECPVFLDTKKELGDWCKDIDFIKINSYEYENNKEIIENSFRLYEKTIVTRGNNGCDFKEKNYPTTNVSVKDVSGAGDTFLSGLVYEYVKTLNIESAIDFAQKCTTIAVQQSGVSVVSKQDINKFFNKKEYDKVRT